MGKLRMAAIMLSCAIVAALFLYFTPLALSKNSTEASTTRVVAQAIGAAVLLAQPSAPQWKLENGCRNDLTETNSVHLALAKGSIKVSALTGAPIHCGHPLSLHNITLQSQYEADLRTPSSVNKQNLYNFDEKPILPTIGDGYGTSVHYDEASSISQISLAEQVEDQTIVGSVHVRKSDGQWRINEAYLTVYQNVLQLVGNTRAKDLAFNDICCTPISGTITTQFTSGLNVAPTSDGSHFVGKTETMTFDGCGQAQLKDFEGHRTHLMVPCL